MTIGPAPMIMIDLMSVRLGIGFIPKVAQIVVGYRDWGGDYKGGLTGEVRVAQRNATASETIPRPTIG